MSLEVEQTALPGCVLLPFKMHRDARGEFVKPFSRHLLPEMDFTTAEAFFSTSGKGVVRGMHFQLPPEDSGKVVFCLGGSVVDVIVDLRKGSPTYQKWIQVPLNDDNRKAIFIPRGMAHGFCAVEDGSIMGYLVDSAHSPQHDHGIHWNSFGFSWPVEGPIVSERDSKLPRMQDFDSPFRFG